MNIINEMLVVLEEQFFVISLLKTYWIFTLYSTPRCSRNSKSKSNIYLKP